MREGESAWVEGKEWTSAPILRNSSQDRTHVYIISAVSVIPLFSDSFSSISLLLFFSLFSFSSLLTTQPHPGPTHTHTQIDGSCWGSFLWIFVRLWFYSAVVSRRYSPDLRASTSHCTSFSCNQCDKLWKCTFPSLKIKTCSPLVPYSFTGFDGWQNTCSPGWRNME